MKMDFGGVHFIILSLAEAPTVQRIWRNLANSGEILVKFRQNIAAFWQNQQNVDKCKRLESGAKECIV